MSDLPFIPRPSVSAPVGPAPRPAPVEEKRVEEKELRYAGFGFTSRIVHHDRPATPPLLILGGSSQDRCSWLRHERWLSRSSTVVTVDLPGYGTADFLPVRYGIDFLAAAVRHTLTELGITRVNLVGACFGGSIAMRFAQHYPHLLGRLLLVGMAQRLPGDYVELVDRWRVQAASGRLVEIADELVERFTATSTAGPVRRQAAVARFLRSQFLHQDEDELAKWVEHNARLVAHEWYRPEPMPAVPALVVTGEYDNLTPPDEGRSVADVLPSAQFTTIKEADHLAPVERVPEFAELVARFCADQPLDGLPYCNELEYLGTTSAAHRAETVLPMPTPV